MTDKRKPHKDFICQDCKADFKRYDTKQTKCPSCQEQFRNARKKYYTKVCTDCGSSFQIRNCRALRCKACIKESPKLPKGALNWANVERRSGEIVTFYFLKITDGQDQFYKVGITSGLTRRLEAFSSVFDTVELISSFTGEIQKCFELEQSILSEVDSYRPVKKFSGYTECFVGELPANANLRIMKESL